MSPADRSGAADAPLFERMALIGMGLIGSSLARAVASKGLVRSVVGCARSEATRDKALELGLVHEVAPPEQLLERALALARELAEGPQVAMRMLKRSIYQAAESTFAHALEDIAARTSVTDHHPDAREGVAAFNEKRAPRFNEWLESS